MKNFIRNFIFSLFLVLSFYYPVYADSVLDKELYGDKKGRTVIEFECSEDIFKVSDNWALAENYHVRKEEPFKKLYKKGYGMLYAPVFVEVSQNEKTVHLEAYVSPNVEMRVLSLFLMPKEMNIHSKSLVGRVPRDMGKTSVNRFLREMDQKTIR